MTSAPAPPLPMIVLSGPTASGKTALALALAQRFHAEILSCDSVAVYRDMELGTAKPTPHERTLIPHHLLDLYDPDQPCTAGDYARHARTLLTQFASRHILPVLSGGTGLYQRALLDGLSPAPPPNSTLRQLLRRRVEGGAATRPSAHLHRTLTRLDPHAASLIHPNDTPKLIRAIEVALALRRRRPPWEALSQRPIELPSLRQIAPLTGYRILRLTLAPTRPELYDRIDHRAAAMFAHGLVDETRALIARFGSACRPFTSLGYAQAHAVLVGTLTEPQAIAHAQQGHRNYAKRQLTWFRKEADLHPTHWLPGPGDSPTILAQATNLVATHLNM